MRGLHSQTKRSAIVSLWRNLAGVGFFSFAAAAGAGSKSGWSGRGNGRVDTTEAADTLRFHEQGFFRPAGQTDALSCRNVYRWDYDPNGIDLSHERFGHDAPVRLFRLIPAAPDRFVSARPHVCGADRYSGELYVAADGLYLTWWIVGPRKNETIRYVYRALDQARDIGRFE